MWARADATCGATYNYNELNILENGVLDEFRLAQENLQANIAAGRGANFRYFGDGTGTSPLPISLAYFSGRTDAGNTGAYGSGNFASSTFVNPLAALQSRTRSPGAPRSTRRRRQSRERARSRAARRTSSSPIPTSWAA